jgi:flagellar biosynthetic protein FliO
LFTPQTAELAPTGFGMALLKLMVALLVVCGLAYGALRLLRRHLVASGTRGSILRVVDRCPLAPRQNLWVVEVGRRRLLIGTTDGCIAKLAELEPGEVKADTRQEGARKSFKEVLTRRGTEDPPPEDEP